jgi:hypothetical protein
MRLESRGEELLRLAVAVNIGCVEESYSGVNAGVNYSCGPLGINSAPEVVAAKADQRHLEPRIPEVAILHLPGLSRFEHG